MEFKLSQEHKLIKQNARDFAQKELLPNVLERDEKKIWPKEAVKKMAKLGFFNSFKILGKSSFKRSNTNLA